jgi:PAS domain S-box-containing protein
MTLPLAAVVRGHARAQAGLTRGAAIVASSDAAILSKTLDGIITTWNAGAERLYGYSAREAIGQPISMLIPRERADELPKILARLARGERLDHFETVRRTKDGRLLDVSVTVSPTLDATGRIFGASTIARDITAQREIEAANRERDALRSVASLAAAAAHEINNPLAVVVGQAQLLDDAVDASERRRIAEILEAAQRIEAIVARMKRISRIELMEKSLDLPEALDIRKSSEPGAGDD